MTSLSKIQKSSNSILQTFKSDNQELSLLNLTNQMIESGEIKTPLEFAEKFMFSLESKEEFPIDINLLIEWKVYDRKDHIKTKIKKKFILDTDYQVREGFPELSGKPNSTYNKGGRPEEIIKMTIDCFKTLCMLSNNEIGKQVKMYYLELEKIFKKYIVIQYENQLKLKDNEINQCKVDYKKLLTNHNNLLKRKKRDSYESGSVIYIISHQSFTKDFNTYYFKFGKAEQTKTEGINPFVNRLSIQYKFILFI